MYMLLLLLCVFGAVSGEHQQELSIAEGLAAGTLVGRVGGSEGDSAGPPFIILGLDSAGPCAHEHALSVSERNGEIRSLVPLDRERCAQYRFMAVPMLGSESDAIRVSVSVLDANDHRPRFDTAQMVLRVDENSLGRRYALPTAVDPDSGRNSIQRYRLSETSLFRLVEEPDRNRLQLEVIGRLDREERDEYALELEAIDGQDLVGRIRIRVEIVDANDNAPRFAKERYRASVKESVATRALVVELHASDADAGENARLRFSIDRRLSSDPDGHFEVDPESGAVRVARALDYERQARYELVAIVSDSGTVSPQLSASVPIEIVVEPVNDNRPRLHVLFLNEENRAAIGEDAPPGTPIASISIRDLDLGDRSTLSIVDEQQEDEQNRLALVESGRDQWLLQVGADGLDREAAAKNSTVSLRLRATDRGGLSSDIERIDVRLLDVNDNAPQFDQASYRIELDELTMPSDALLRVAAHDLDEGNNSAVRFRIKNSNDLLTVGAQSGVVRLRRPLQCSELGPHALQVEASDLGEPMALTASARLELQAARASSTIRRVRNDQGRRAAPILQRGFYNISVGKEQLKTGTCFFHVSGTIFSSKLCATVRRVNISHAINK